MEKVCEAVGVKSVKVVDPADLSAFERTLKEELLREEVSVIIARRPCALLEKKNYKGFIINDKCKKCKACLKLGCPAISFTGGVMKIDRSLCTECGLCASVCKFGAIEKRGE